jgi:hypothetical protein
VHGYSLFSEHISLNLYAHIDKSIPASPNTIGKPGASGSRNDPATTRNSFLD